MPSSNKTEYAHLNQWVSTDKPKMQDFNADNAAIDAALKALTQSEGVSNPNLLINTDFKNPVNQRVATSKTDAGYFIDRWCKGADGTASISNNGLTLDSTGTDYIRIFQMLESPIRNGEKVSISWSDGQGTYSATGTVSYDGDTPAYFANAEKTGNPYQYVRCATESNTFRVDIVCVGVITIEWVKLEIGSVATPIVPKLYGEELAMCQRYYEISYPLQLHSCSVTDIINGMPFKVTKRVVPKVEIITSNYMKNKINSWNNTQTVNVTVVAASDTAILYIATDGSIVTNGYLYGFIADAEI